MRRAARTIADAPHAPLLPSRTSQPHCVATHYATAELLLRLQALRVDHVTPIVVAALAPSADVDARDSAHERFALVRRARARRCLRDGATPRAAVALDGRQRRRQVACQDAVRHARRARRRAASRATHRPELARRRHCARRPRARSAALAAVREQSSAAALRLARWPTFARAGWRATRAAPRTTSTCTRHTTQVACCTRFASSS